MKQRVGLLGLALFCVVASWASAEELNLHRPPAKFDLRDLGAVTPIKKQQGGTCWTHGTMAALESNLLMSGMWKAMGNGGYPSLSEYHLDWWNGFNRHANDDLPDATKHDSGLKVHLGGDYRVSAAYFSRGDGAVPAPVSADKKVDTTSWYKDIPKRQDAGFRKLYVRDVEWFTLGENLENIDVIKRRIMTEGAIGTAYSVGKGFLSKDFVHYQPMDSKALPNHAVAIIGWDDNKKSADPDSKLPKPGAWLIKNSWGDKRGDNGYYWISYYDKCCGRDPEMGAVSFRNVEPLAYSHVYFHDYHGWRDSLKDIKKGFNAFTATGRQQIRALSFYTSADRVSYTAKLYRKFENGNLSEEAASKSGTYAHMGFHTVNLDEPIWVEANEKFYVCVEFSHGGQAIDRTSVIPVLLGQQPDPKKKEEAKQPDAKKTDAKQPDPKQPEAKKFERKPTPPPTVISKADRGQSYYHDGTQWKDLYDYTFEKAEWNRTANFCMKALAVSAPDRLAVAPPPAATAPPAAPAANAPAATNPKQ